jgi:hypothetical protein
VGTLATLATRSIKGDLEKKVESLIENAFTLPHQFNQKEYDDMFTVHTHTQKFADLKIIPEVSPTIAKVLFNIVKECKFVSNIINALKYFIKIDFTRNQFACIGNYQEGDNFKTFLLKNLSIGQAEIGAYNSVHNDVVQISTKNVDNNKLIGDVKYFDAFILFKILLTDAFNKKTVTKMSGKVKV